MWNWWWVVWYYQHILGDEEQCGEVQRLKVMDDITRGSRNRKFRDMFCFVLFSVLANWPFQCQHSERINIACVVFMFYKSFEIFQPRFIGRSFSMCFSMCSYKSFGIFQPRFIGRSGRGKSFNLTIVLRSFFVLVDLESIVLQSFLCWFLFWWI